MLKTVRDKPKILSKNLFPVVGIGASAGGLEAFRKLVKAIPEKSGMAYIIVQHLHPSHNSSLPEILQRETNIPVCEISDKVEVKPDRIYVIPANKMLVARDGILQLSPRPSKDQKNMPIDIFFSSLAEVHQSHAIGIVLSGNGVDGTLGLQNIKSQGGITFAQALDSAAYDAMPQSAINAEAVDFILAPEKMPQQLLRLSRTFNIQMPGGPAGNEELSEEESFKQLFTLLRIHSKVDFTHYKQTTIRRRILRRMVILRLEKIAEYLDYLKQNQPEQDILFEDILIPVTSFFRDPKAFENLYDTIIPELIKNKSPVKPLRVWIAGCSTGKEAYSVAMCLHDYLSDKISISDSNNIRIQIFATDISEKSIEKARVGLYHQSELAGITQSQLQQYFTKIEDSYQVKKSIRDMCVFARHNFLKDPPFAKIDLISCRNVLIYMEPFLQKKAMITFHYALNENGYLLLGKSETAATSSELFLQLGTKEKIYAKKFLPGKYMAVASEQREETLKDKDYGLRSNEKKKDDLKKNADDILLSKYTPAGVIVNDQFDIVQFRGSTGEFLESSPGKASFNVLKMAREGLSFELRNALHKSKSSNEPFIKDGISINNGKKLITIEVIPLLNSNELHFLILFKDTPAQKINKNGKGKDVQKITGLKSRPLDSRIRELENNLSQAREDMRSITEHQDAVNAELQSNNQELLSGSQELQSLNEELETNKEELESTNEELITVNQELFDRNEQYNKARLYAEAIVTTIHEPLLVLNKDYRIKSANDSFYKTFRLSQKETVGNILFELQDKRWEVPGLRDHLLQIQTGKEKFLDWEITYTFPSVGKRTICFNAQPFQKENGENYILLAFDDITVRKEKDNAEKKSSEELIRLLENIPQITLTAAPDGSITYFNKFFLDYSGMTFDEALKSGWEPLIKPEMLDEFKKSWSHVLETGEEFKMELQLRHKNEDAYRWHLYRASPIRNDQGVISSWVGAATDLHDQKIREQVKDEFMSIASHELKTPLTTAKAYVQLLQLGMEETNNKDLIYAQKAAASIDRLNDLIGELLDVSKIQNGKLALQITTFNFNEMIKAAVEGIQYASPFHNIVVSGEIKEPVTGDKERLQQVVVNLLSNAVKYSPKANKVLVKVGLEKGEIKVSVKDRGIGIRRENLWKIFERYYREEERAVHFQGLGIGLYISYEIIQRHRGKLWAENNGGRGSTFYFTVPM